MSDNIDYEKLRAALMDYFGTAMHGGFPMAVTDLGRIERASGEELLEMAERAGINYEEGQE